MSIFTGKHILLAVTGSIAAYKSADLASKLTQAGSMVDVILSQAAERFVSPLTFQSVTGRGAFTDTDLWGGQAHILHVGLGQSADLFVIAPATANTIAKLAHGIADNLVSITALATRCPILIAPAMDVGMFESPITQENIRLLSGRGLYFAGPEHGRMASGLIGRGRFVEPGELLGHVRLVLGRKGKLVGKKIVVTTGGTQEPIDPVRSITNRSSGRQGFALAQAAIDAGGDVTLISAPTNLTPPVGVVLIRVHTAQEMLAAVLSEAVGAEALIMAAAVADFRPIKTAVEKLKKRDGIPQIILETTPDILLAVAGMGSARPRIVIGFAAESRELLVNATLKLKTKNLDMIAANDISTPEAGFEVDTNKITLLYADARREDLPLMGKDLAADAILERLSAMLESQ